jgi:hypothetical protein
MGYADSLDGEHDPPTDGSSDGTPPKPTNSPLLGREPLSDGPNEGPVQAWRAPRTLTYDCQGRLEKIGACYRSPQNGVARRVIR